MDEVKLGVLIREIKDYLRLDLDDNLEDEVISSMTIAAIELLKESSGKEFAITKALDDSGIEQTTKVLLEDSELGRMAIKMLVSHWYEHRGIQWLSGNFKNVADVSFSFKSILAHITTSTKYI